MSFDYNTTREKLVLPEYGRNLQMMVDHMMMIENREERTRAAHTIIGIMGNINPHFRDISDYSHKLWDHLAMMTDFELDIDIPFETIKADVIYAKPNRVPYKTNSIRFKHYGKNVEFFIQKAIEMEEGDEKRAFVEMMANHMKKLYLTHNRENVTDMQIISDLIDMSGGKLVIPGDLKLVEAKEVLVKPIKKIKKQNRGPKQRSRN